MQDTQVKLKIPKMTNLSVGAIRFILHDHFNWFKARAR